jgi:hypothetical protein
MKMWKPEAPAGMSQSCSALCVGSSLGVDVNVSHQALVFI